MSPELAQILTFALFPLFSIGIGWLMYKFAVQPLRKRLGKDHWLVRGDTTLWEEWRKGH